MLNIIFLLLLASHDGWAQFSKHFGGPFDFIVKEKLNCKDMGTNEMRFESNRFSIYNRTARVYSSHIVLPWGISNDINLWLDVWEYGNGGYHKGMMYKDLGPMCSALKAYTRRTAKSLARALGFKDCPTPPGNFTVKDWVVDIDLTLPVLPYQIVRYDLYFKKDKVTVGCFSLKCEVAPKRKKN